MLDLAITNFVQSLVPKQLDLFLSVFSLVGSFEVTTVILTWWVGGREGMKKMIAVMTIFAVGMGIEVAGKTFIYHPGPPKPLNRYQLPFAFPSSGFSTGNSFPSGHSFRTIFLTIIALGYAGKNRKIKLAWVAFAAIMLFSRVSLGEHWTSDVTGGVVLGVVLGSISRQFKAHEVVG